MDGRTILIDQFSLKLSLAVLMFSLLQGCFILKLGVNSTRFNFPGKIHVVAILLKRSFKNAARVLTVSMNFHWNIITNSSLFQSEIMYLLNYFI